MNEFYRFESLTEDQQEKLRRIFPDIDEGDVVSGFVLYQYAPPHRPPSQEQQWADALGEGLADQARWKQARLRKDTPPPSEATSRAEEIDSVGTFRRTGSKDQSVRRFDTRSK